MRHVPQSKHKQQRAAVAAAKEVCREEKRRRERERERERERARAHAKVSYYNGDAPSLLHSCFHV